MLSLNIIVNREIVFNYFWVFYKKIITLACYEWSPWSSQSCLSIFIISTQNFSAELHHMNAHEVVYNKLIRAIINTCNRLNISSVVHGIVFRAWRSAGKSDGWDKIRRIPQWPQGRDTLQQRNTPFTFTHMYSYSPLLHLPKNNREEERECIFQRRPYTEGFPPVIF